MADVRTIPPFNLTKETGMLSMVLDDRWQALESLMELEELDLTAPEVQECIQRRVARTPEFVERHGRCVRRGIRRTFRPKKACVGKKCCTGHGL